MTLTLRLWPLRRNPSGSETNVSRSRWRDEARPQAPLIATWRRGKDGRLESRWKQAR